MILGQNEGLVFERTYTPMRSLIISVRECTYAAIAYVVGMGLATPGLADPIPHRATMDTYDCSRPQSEVSEHIAQYLNGQLNEWVVFTDSSADTSKISCVELRRPSHRSLNAEEAADLLRIASAAQKQDETTLLLALEDAARRFMSGDSPPGDSIASLDIYADTTGIVTTHFGVNDTIACSGILISPDAVLTAGRCVFDKDKGGYAPSGEFFPGHNMPMASLWQVEPQQGVPMAPGGSFVIMESADTGGQSNLDGEWYDIGRHLAIMRLTRPATERNTLLPISTFRLDVTDTCCKTYGYDISVMGNAVVASTHSEVLDGIIDSAPDSGRVNFGGVTPSPGMGSTLFPSDQRVPGDKTSAIAGVVTQPKQGILITRHNIDQMLDAVAARSEASDLVTHRSATSYGTNTAQGDR